MEIMDPIMFDLRLIEDAGFITLQWKAAHEDKTKFKNLLTIRPEVACQLGNEMIEKGQALLEKAFAPLQTKIYEPKQSSH